MGATMTLVLEGRGSLTFPEGRRYRRVDAGEPFVVDAATARVLLATDPAVTVMDAADNPPEPAPDAPDAPEPTLESMTVTSLVAMAEALGLTIAKRARKDDVIAAIESERARLAAEAAAAVVEAVETATGDQRPEAAEEPTEGQVPADTGPDVEDDPTLGHGTDLTALTGAVTIADLPDGAKLAPEQL